MKELAFNSSGKSNDKNGTYDQINAIMGNDIINEHKEYSYNYYGRSKFL